MLKKMSLSKKIVAVGLALGLTLASGGVGLAASIDVEQLPIKFIVNNVDKTPSDNDGNPSSFIYNGSTYVPIRLVANLLNIPVNWDGRTASVLIGNSTASGIYLSDKNPDSTKGEVSLNSDLSVNGVKSDKGLTLADDHVNASYNVNGKYSKLSFQFGMSDRMYKGTVGAEGGTLKVLGDGKELWSSTFLYGTPPQDANIDISGVLKLELVMDSKSPLGSSVCILNPLLTP